MAPHDFSDFIVDAPFICFVIHTDVCLQYNKKFAHIEFKSAMESFCIIRIFRYEYP